MTRFSIIIIPTIFLFSSQQVLAQDQIYKPINEKLVLDLPVLDYPYNKHAAKMAYNKRMGSFSGNANNAGLKDFILGYESPSMSQVLAITKNLHTTNYYFNNKFWNQKIKPTTKKKYYLNRLGANANSGIIDYLMAYQLMVFGPVWLHEEFHRNGLTLQSISSFDDTYYRLGGNGTAGGAITKIKDEDLIRFKENAPVEMARTFAAGIEGQYSLLRNMQKDNFFKKTDYANILMNILITKQAINYVNEFKKPDYDASIDSMNKYGGNITERDFVGWDFTPWVYDLFRPEEAYTARGVHPNGNGINRAIKRSQLSPEEDAYLAKMGRLQYLNFLSPNMIGINRIKLNENTHINFAIRHLLTSYGYDMSADIFLEKNNRQWLISLHNYHNLSHSYPGLEIIKPDLKVAVASKQIAIEARAMLWIQPEKQSFYASKGKAGGLLQAKGYLPLNKTINFYAEGEGKTNGWVAANPFLKKNFSVRTGLSFNF